MSENIKCGEKYFVQCIDCKKAVEYGKDCVCKVKDKIVS